MDWIQITATPALTAVITAIVTWLARPYFDAYLRKKGEQKAVLEDLAEINRKLEEIRSDFVERNAYLAEKGKTAATKEDVEEINRKIESVRSEYVRTIELLKWQLSKRATLHRLQVEKEFEVFSIIWEAAVDLRFATQQLRPILEHIDPDESEEARWQRKFGTFSERRNLFLEANGETADWPLRHGFNVALPSVSVRKYACYGDSDCSNRNCDGGSSGSEPLSE